MTLRARDIVLAPLLTEGAVEQIVRRLGEAIGAGVLAPGERLPAEGDLAGQLGVAPMTLRSALAILREAGFLETRRGRGGGSFVSADPPGALVSDGRPPSHAELRALTDWRRAISGEAAALAAERSTPESLAAIGEQAQTTLAAVGDVSEFRRADARFHLAIAEASRSPRLGAAEAGIQTELADALALVPGPRLARAVSQAGHAPIVDAIAARDPTAARTAMERHAEGTYDWIIGLRLGTLDG